MANLKHSLRSRTPLLYYERLRYLTRWKAFEEYSGNFKIAASWSFSTLSTTKSESIHSVVLEEKFESSANTHSITLNVGKQMVFCLNARDKLVFTMEKDGIRIKGDRLTDKQQKTLFLFFKDWIIDLLQRNLAYEIQSRLSAFPIEAKWNKYILSLYDSTNQTRYVQIWTADDDGKSIIKGAYLIPDPYLSDDDESLE